MHGPLACAGVPRDLGALQGRALGEVIRARVGPPGIGDALRRPPRPLALVDRDLRRHHPQLAERIDGLALGARVSRRGLVEALAQEAGLGAAAPLGAAAFAADADGRPRLGKLFADSGALLVRSVRADAGIPFLDATLAWLPTSLAGVNEAGLAAAVCLPKDAAASPGRCAAPALALVQDCLQRFATAEAALAWCLSRPAGGRAWIALADASGALAAAEIDGDRRARREPELVSASASSSGSACVWLDPAGRRLCVGRSGSAPLEWIAL